MLRYQCTMHLCQAASGKNSAALSVSPRHARRCLRNPLQPALSSFAPSRMPRLFTAIDTRSETVRTSPAQLRFEYDPIEIHIRVLALNRPIASSLDRPVDLLVQVSHRRRRKSRAPQGLGDVLHPAHRNARQIHLDQCLLHRGRYRLPMRYMFGKVASQN